MLEEADDRKIHVSKYEAYYWENQMNQPINIKLIFKILSLDHSESSCDALDSLGIKLTTCDRISVLYLWRRSPGSIEAQ